MENNEWQPMSSAPRDGSMIELKRGKKVKHVIVKGKFRLKPMGYSTKEWWTIYLKGPKSTYPYDCWTEDFIGWRPLVEIKEDYVI